MSKTMNKWRYGHTDLIPGELYTTDYPFTELGDEAGKAVTPPRIVKLVEYDGDKYCDVVCTGVGSQAAD